MPEGIYNPWEDIDLEDEDDVIDPSEAKAKEEAEIVLAAEEEGKAKEGAKAQAEEESKVREETEARMKVEAEAKAREEMEARMKAEAEAKAWEEMEARMKAEAEAKVREEMEARMKAEAEAKVREEMEARMQAEADANVRKEGTAGTVSKSPPPLPPGQSVMQLRPGEPGAIGDEPTTAPEPGGGSQKLGRAVVGGALVGGPVAAAAALNLKGKKEKDEADKPRPFTDEAKISDVFKGNKPK